MINFERANNFYGMRFGSISLNVFTSFVFSTLIVLKKDFNFNCFFKTSVHKFFIWLMASGFLIGMINLVLGNIYMDNFLSDILTYLPLFFFVVILSVIDIKDVNLLFKYCFGLTVIAMILCYFFDVYFEYAVGKRYVLINSIGFIAPVFVLFTYKIYSKYFYVVLLSMMLFLLASGYFFISGKTIIMFFIAFVWGGFYLFKGKIIFVIPIIILLIITTPFIILKMIEFFDGNPVITYKFSQVYAIFNTDIHSLAKAQTSFGNIVAEILTASSDLYFSSDFFMIFGKGFGGGIKDVFGYLSSWVNRSGYSFKCATRDYYYKMHLPITELFVKSGLLGVLLHSFVLIKNFTKKNIYGFGFVLMFSLVFYTSKENLLLTLVFLKLMSFDTHKKHEKKT